MIPTLGVFAILLVAAIGVAHYIGTRVLETMVDAVSAAHSLTEEQVGKLREHAFKASRLQHVVYLGLGYVFAWWAMGRESLNNMMPAVARLMGPMVLHSIDHPEGKAVDAGVREARVEHLRKEDQNDFGVIYERFVEDDLAAVAVIAVDDLGARASLFTSPNDGGAPVPCTPEAWASLLAATNDLQRIVEHAIAEEGVTRTETVSSETLDESVSRLHGLVNEYGTGVFRGVALLAVRDGGVVDGHLFLQTTGEPAPIRASDLVTLRLAVDAKLLPAIARAEVDLFSVERSA